VASSRQTKLRTKASGLIAKGVSWCSSYAGTESNCSADRSFGREPRKAFASVSVVCSISLNWKLRNSGSIQTHSSGRRESPVIIHTQYSVCRGKVGMKLFAIFPFRLKTRFLLAWPDAVRRHRNQSQQKSVRSSESGRLYGIKFARSFDKSKL
jgi:hypothetical protein